MDEKELATYTFKGAEFENPYTMTDVLDRLFHEGKAPLVRSKETFDLNVEYIEISQEKDYKKRIDNFNLFFEVMREYQHNYDKTREFFGTIKIHPKDLTETQDIGTLVTVTCKNNEDQFQMDVECNRSSVYERPSYTLKFT